MNNYEFCAHWVFDQSPPPGARALDYGCGAGQIVNELRNRGIDAFGCDIFYDGGDSSPSISRDLLGQGIIRKMESDTIPFDDSTFDFVVNNQVLEHVANLDRVLGEMYRVLKPGGSILSLFPDKGVWREGHCGVPFLHWFPKKSSARVYYAAAFRSLGFGHFKSGKSVMVWSRDFCDWLDTWTFYRSTQEIGSTYGKYFHDVRHEEDQWLRQRVGSGKAWVSWLPAPLRRWVVRKLAGLVIVARKQ